MQRVESNQTSGGTVSNDQQQVDEEYSSSEQEINNNDDVSESSDKTLDSDEKSKSAVSDSVDSEDMRERIRHTVKGMLKNYCKKDDLYDEMD